MREDEATQDNPSEDAPQKSRAENSGVSRRDFLKISTVSAAVVPVLGTTVAEAAGQSVRIHGPGKVPVTLTVNGEQHKLQLEPRVTLLDALRDRLEITGAKRVCDRAECGACTVLMDKKAVYACSVLAIEAQGKPIATVESFMQGDQLDPVQRAFVENDGSQCGFCTSGFVVATKAFLEKYPNPTPEDIRRGLSGNLCRCGTYHGIQGVIAQMAQMKQGA